MSDYKFEPFQKVLGRECPKDNWKIDLYVNYDPHSSYPHNCFRFDFAECIPYEGNEHFLGTNDDPAPKWKPKPDDLVAVSDNKSEWTASIFLGKAESGKFLCQHWAGMPDCTVEYRYCEPIRKHFNVPEE